MPKFAANLTMLFTEVPFLDRFEHAAKAGFEAVEFLFPYAFEPREIKAAARRERPEAGAAQPAGRRLGRRRARHRLPAGPRRRVPRRRRRGRSSYATALGVPQLNCLAGKAPTGARRRDAAQRPSSTTCSFAAAELKKAGLKLLIEPINTFDIPGFYLNRTRAGAGDPRRRRRRQRLRAVRHLPHAAHGRRARRDAAEAPGAHRATSSSPTTRAATSRAAARSTTPSCSRTSTASATAAGSAANTSRPRRTEAGLGWRQRAGALDWRRKRSQRSDRSGDASRHLRRSRCAVSS